MTGRLDFVRGVYVEDHLPSWRGSSAFQHHVRVSRIAERRDCTYACLQFATINELGDYAQPLCGHVPLGRRSTSPPTLIMPSPWHLQLLQRDLRVFASDRRPAFRISYRLARYP